MSSIIEYYKNLPDNLSEPESISKTFINFYIYFKRLHEKKLLSNNTIYFLDTALDFSQTVVEDAEQTIEYLNAKIFQIDQFLLGLKNNYNKFIKGLKKTFDIPKSYSYEEVCTLIKQSYIAYAALRYKHNLLNTKMLEETTPIDKKFYKVPKYIPDTNANISEFLELASGIKSLSLDGKSYELFNVFNPSLYIRAIIDINDGQIVAIFINGEEYTEVPSSLIKKLKQQIKKGTTNQKTDIKSIKK